ncbi:hypothetical protein pb186bvf_009538, partial [Paramecium bursaria]
MPKVNIKDPMNEFNVDLKVFNFSQCAPDNYDKEGQLENLVQVEPS